MLSVQRALLVSGVCATAMLPAFAQQAPTAPALSLPQVFQRSAAIMGPPTSLGGVPPDLGALPKPASPPAAPAGDTATRTTAAAETYGDDAPALARPARRLAAPTPAGGRTEHVLFDRLPVPILLTPGRERLVRFPFVPLIDVPPSVQGVLEVQIIEDTAYLTARGAVPRTRLVAHAIEGGTKLPLDIEAVDGKDAMPILQIHLPNEAAADDDDAAASAARSTPEPVGMIQLTRYAAQVLYAPSRLVPTYPGVRQEPVERTPVVGLYRGGEVETAPLGAWSSGTLHVTAIRFTNRSTHPLELDMERLRGRWIAATPQHWLLLPNGSEADTTAVYLVSDRPYATVALWR
ncbi:TIGR03749 family integrating conjugative element protein [Aromatoleum bremense]|uniref:TIGR03749 family integrating conjugative element protein n=1 Tax=Aromatoleum bremense TaxID=76115 RepID=A0ABX1NXR8_9RHOO|nr:TIGR03749 family integrating conjugative element protein [Aromatoleum bremense]NMG16262.1 TIGR03749 family integrating conjugative element protein [Aromatoleum bremense]QTQ30092.1 Integrating conjugative element membrane protein, PFL4704 [Aromatoleum bremense]